MEPADIGQLPVVQHRVTAADSTAAFLLLLPLLLMLQQPQRRAVPCQAAGRHLAVPATPQADGMPASCSSSTFLTAAVSCTSGLATVTWNCEWLATSTSIRTSTSTYAKHTWRLHRNTVCEEHWLQQHPQHPPLEYTEPCCSRSDEPSAWN